MTESAWQVARMHADTDQWHGQRLFPLLPYWTARCHNSECLCRTEKRERGTMLKTWGNNSILPDKFVFGHIDIYGQSLERSRSA